MNAASLRLLYAYPYVLAAALCLGLAGANGPRAPGTGVAVAAVCALGGAALLADPRARAAHG